jgi:mannitol/fructose-specific phosphotransferase system IIA component (Ntr-type)
MLEKALSDDVIILKDSVKSWQDAIRDSAKPLVDAGKVLPKYVQSIIDNVIKLGPYIKIGDFVALPHSRPEDGVKEIGVSVLKLNKPINLLDNAEYPIKLFICLAAIDNSSHIDIMAELAKCLSDAERLKKMLATNSKQELRSLIVEE